MQFLNLERYKNCQNMLWTILQGNHQNPSLTARLSLFSDGHPFFLAIKYFILKTVKQ